MSQCHAMPRRQLTRATRDKERSIDRRKERDQLKETKPNNPVKKVLKNEVQAFLFTQKGIRGKETRAVIADDDGR